MPLNPLAETAGPLKKNVYLNRSGLLKPRCGLLSEHVAAIGSHLTPSPGLARGAVAHING